MSIEKGDFAAPEDGMEDIHKAGFKIRKPVGEEPDTDGIFDLIADFDRATHPDESPGDLLISDGEVTDEH